MTRTLAFALCADDYAMTPGISAGILEALDAGALSATSVMTTSPWWPEAAVPLQRYAGTADIGLHVNLTLGSPLTTMPKLAPHGRFPDIRTLLRLDRGRNLPLDEIGQEIDRQCQHFAEAFGKAPDHIDGHQHIHVIGSIRPLLFDSLARRGWRPWLRDASDRLWRLLRRASPAKALAVSVLADGFAADARRAGFACNNGFAGFSTFDSSKPYARQFESYLRSAGPRHLVMCHPGHVDDELRRLDPVVETREQELRFLISELPPVLRERSATLIRVSQGA